MNYTCQRAGILLSIVACASCASHRAVPVSYTNEIESRALLQRTVENIAGQGLRCFQSALYGTTGVYELGTVHNYLNRETGSVPSGEELERYSLHLFKDWYVFSSDGSPDQETQYPEAAKLAQALHQSARHYPESTLDSLDPDWAPEGSAIDPRCHYTLSAPILSNEYAFVGRAAWHPDWSGRWIDAYQRVGEEWNLIAWWRDPRVMTHICCYDPFQELNEGN